MTSIINCEYLSSVQAEANFEMTTLMRSDLKNVLNLLLLHLSTHRERVLVGVKMLAEMNQPSEEQKTLHVDNEQQIVSHERNKNTARVLCAFMDVIVFVQ